MSAGTLTLANNSDVVAGIDTSFTTDLSAGDFIIVTTGGVTYTLPVKTIESDTALTLARNYNGPAVTGAAWTAMPRDTLNRISAQIAADTAYAIRQRVLEIDNWYQLLEVNGDVTIKMADGSSYTGPSWLKLIDAMNNPTWALAKSKNLSDLEDRDEAWMNVRPTGPTPLAADPVTDSDAATMGWVKSFVVALRSIASAWSVIVTLASAPANSTTVKGGKLRSVLQIGNNEYAAAEVQASVTTSSAGARTVSAEVNVIDTTSGTAVSKTIKLGTVDGLTGGTLTSGIKPSANITSVDGTLVNGGPLLQAEIKDQFNNSIISQLFPELNAGSFSQTALANYDGGAKLTRYWIFRSDGNAYAISGNWVNGSSDMRVKKNFEKIKDPLSTMLKIKAGTWRMNTKDGGDRFGIGVLANGLYDDYPEAALENGDQELADGTIVKNVLTVQAGDSGVLAAVHHASIIKLMDTVKNALNTIAGITTDESAKAALEALAEKIPASE